MNYRIHIFLALLVFGSAWSQNLWTPRVSGTTKNLNAVIWNGQQAMAVGDSGKIFTSVDGISWLARNSGVAASLQAVAWGNGTYVAVGDGIILSSKDGAVWTAQGSGQSPVSGNSSNYLTSVTWGGNQFVAVGLFGVVMTSPDGTEWISRNAAPTGYNFHSVAWTGTQIVASADYGYILLSADGIQWRTIYLHSPNGYSVNARALLWTGTKLAAFNGSEFMASNDGVNWSYLNIGLRGSSLPMNCMAWTGFRYVALGSQIRVATSTDGTEWIKPTIAADGSLNSVAWTGDLLVAVGRAGTIITSPMDSVVREVSPPSVEFPKPNAVNVASPVTLTWISSHPPYDLQLARDVDFTVLDRNDSGLTEVQKVADLPYKSNYYWRVRSRTSQGISPWSEAWVFSTDATISVNRATDYLAQPVELSKGGHLRFALSSREHVVVQTLDFNGRSLSRLLDETRPSGHHEIALPSHTGGAYLLDFRAGKFHKTLKVYPAAP